MVLATANSGSPSPLRSAQARDLGKGPVPYPEATTNDKAPAEEVFRTAHTLAPVRSSTARSSRPSPSRSSSSMSSGVNPRGIVLPLVMENVPVPAAVALRITRTPLSTHTATSGRPSPSRSPTERARPGLPTPKLCTGPKATVPATDIFGCIASICPVTPTKSALPSPSISATDRLANFSAVSASV